MQKLTHLVRSVLTTHPDEVAGARAVVRRLRDDLISRCVVIALVGTLLWLSVGPATAVAWLLLVVANELVEHELCRQCMDETRNDLRCFDAMRLNFLFGTSAWAFGAVQLWVSDDTAYHFMALALVIGALVHVAFHYSTWPKGLLVVSLPMAACLFLFPAIWLASATFSVWNAALFGLAFLALTYYLTSAALHNIEVQQGLETRVRERTIDLEHARDEAEAANRAKSQFIANMSHELRTPLNAILGYSDLMRETAEEDHRPDDVADHDRVIRAGNTLLALINDVLDFSKIEAGRMELHPETVDIGHLLTEAAEAVRPAMSLGGNTFLVRLADDLGTASLDGLKLKQCVLNLLSNAAKFTTGGEVVVSARRIRKAEGEALTLSVRDTGCGMDAETLEQVFQPFVQADNSNTRRHDGTGLGLCITSQLVNLMQGELSATSTPGVGTVFTITLPLPKADTVTRQDTTTPSAA